MATRTMNKTNVMPQAEETSAKVVDVKDDVKKEYDQEELISCRSLVSGGLYVIGPRSNYLYTWADYGDVVGVEYRDLIFMVRSQDKTIFEPRIIIEDNDIVSDNTMLSKLYNSLYSIGDFTKIVNSPVSEMLKSIEALPVSARNAFKDHVVSMIDRKQLDSIKKIKAIDEYFGTSYLLALTDD